MQPTMNPLSSISTGLVLAAMIFLVGCHDPVVNKIPPSNIKTDEDILLFPTYGRFDNDDKTWRFQVHGKVYEPENSSTKREAFITLLSAATNLDDDVDDASFIDDRVRPFLVDNERDKSITIQVAGESFPAGTSESNGHFSNALSSKNLGSGADSAKTKSDVSNTSANQSLKVTAVLPDGDQRSFSGRLHLIPSRGVSVISDIDDTIKHSQVTNKQELIKNTFIRPFQSVDGMSEVYSGLAKSNVAFHYVSGSPWQLYQPIATFLSESGFPEGTFHLKHFRLKDSSAIELLSSQEKTKLAAITPLLHDFPDRRFILIGDSGEQDPEIYGQIARDFPEQIIGIFIRNVTEADREDTRFLEAFKDVNEDSWVLFNQASSITDRITALASP